jgi:hypothetical protein
MRRRSAVPDFDDGSAPTPLRPPRPTLRRLPLGPSDPLYLDILADYEEAILSGCSKDDAAHFAIISDQDHMRLLGEQLKVNPEWINELESCGKGNLKATARVQAARKVRAGDAAFVMPIVQATNEDLNPKQSALPQGNTYNVVTYQIAVLPDGTKKVIESSAPVEAVITEK